MTSTPASLDLHNDPHPNTLGSMKKHFVAVKSPCMADGMFYSTHNMSIAPNATQLSF